jgi:hypothetical protein
MIVVDLSIILLKQCNNIIMSDSHEYNSESISFKSWEESVVIHQVEFYLAQKSGGGVGGGTYRKV